MGSMCSNKPLTIKNTKPIAKFSKPSSELKNKYEYICMLGNGSFGKVRLYRDKLCKDMKVAIKTIKKEGISNVLRDCIIEEVNILRELDHPNIVKYYDTYEDELYVHLVMSYLQGEDLFKVISSKSYHQYSEFDVTEIISNLFNALSFIHNKKIVHRDIKPENILFSVPGNYQTLKLIDFGLSTHTLKKKTGELMGTPLYMAPEIIDGVFSYKSDIWSVGVILYVLMTGKFPFSGENIDDLLYNIQENPYDLVNLNQSKCSKEAKDLISKLLRKKEEDRLSIEQALEHRWFKKYNKNAKENKTNGKEKIKNREDKENLENLEDIEDTENNTQLLQSGIVDSIKKFTLNNSFQKEVLFYIAKISNDEEIAKLKETFTKLDRDNTGTLTYDEIFTGFQEIGLKINREEVDEIWNGLDFHKDGEVNYTEFLAATISSINFLKEEKVYCAFRYFNSKDTEFLTAESVINALKSNNVSLNEEEVKQFFKDFQMSGKKLDFYEFKKLIITEGTLISLTQIQMMEQNKRPNKMEMLKERMNEREELEKNFAYNPFGKGGNGAPMRDYNGNVITVRKGITNNLYRENGNPYEGSANENNNNYPMPNANNGQNVNNGYNTPMPTGNNNNSKINNANDQPNGDRNNYYNSLNKNEHIYNYQTNPYLNFKQNQQDTISNYNMKSKNYTNYTQPNTMNINNDYISNQNQNQKKQVINQPSSNQREYTNTNSNTNQITGNYSYKPDSNTSEPQYDTYKAGNYNNSNNNNEYITNPGVSSEQDVKRTSYQNDLLKQIEEKKNKREDEKRKEAELDRMEEEKYKQYLGLKKEQDDQIKSKRSKYFKLTSQILEKNFNQTEEENTNPNLNSNNNLSKPNTNMNANMNTNNQAGNENRFERNIEMNYPRNRAFDDKIYPPQEMNVNIFKEAIGMTYENLNRNIREDANSQISKLKSEVSKQYSEINEIFNKLRMDVSEASQLKFEAERELNKLKDEMEKKKVTNLLYEDKFNLILDKHAPYNNLHIPFDEVNPMFPTNNKNNVQANRGKHLSLKSTSTMVYNKEEYMEEKEDFKLKAPMSKLAKRGQNLMGDSEFVPIVTPLPRNKDENTLDPYITPNTPEDGIDYFSNNNNNNYNDISSKLNEITHLNSQMDPSVKYKSLKANFDTDMNNKLDDMFNDESAFLK